MLYDNGLLLEVYARSYARTGDPEAARIARETAAFLGREMSAPEGAFWSAIDAETDGHEGAYYVWTRQELEAALGAEDAAFLAPLYGFDGPPFFEGDSYVLRLPEPVAELARRRQLAPDALLAEMAPLRARLLAARDRRQRPATDDKVLADWNGTAIAGLAAAGEALAEPELVARAARAAEFLVAALRPAGGPLLHAWRGGTAKIPAMLSDYAFLVHGLLALHKASGEERWLDAAAELTREQIARLGDEQEGGFFTAGASADVLFRSKDIFDGALPGANAVAALNLIELAERTEEPEWLDEARRTLQAFGGLVESFPEGARMMAIAAERYAEAAGEAARPAGVAVEAAAPSAVGELEELGRRLVTARLEVGEAGEGGWRPFRLALRIAPGWHLNANPPVDPALIPTTVAAEGMRLRGVAYPASEGSFYEGEVQIAGALAAAAPNARLLVTYQPCDDSRCLPPVRLELQVPA
jgi:hypothetical protein